MNVSLAPDHEQMIDTKLNSGRYESAIEVIRDALRLLDERDRLQETRLAELKYEVGRGLIQLDRGESAPLDIDEIKAKARQLRC